MKTGNNLTQEFEPLASKICRLQRQAGDIASRPTPGLSHVAQHIEEEGIVPTCTFELAAKGSFGVGMGAGNVESEATQDGEVGRCIVLATTRQVFVEQHIERPM